MCILLQIETDPKYFFCRLGELETASIHFISWELIRAHTLAHIQRPFILQFKLYFYVCCVEFVPLFLVNDSRSSPYFYSSFLF